MYNDKIEDIGDGKDKLNYYFLLNNLDLNNDYKNFQNCDNYNNDLIKSLNFRNFMNEEKRNELLNLNDIGNKELKKNLFKIQSDVNIKNKDLSNEENYEMVNNYQNIPLKERMTIKKQKTKKLLENKTHRISTQEESKENNVDKNTISINTQEKLF